MMNMKKALIPAIAGLSLAACGATYTTPVATGAGLNLAQAQAAYPDMSNIEFTQLDVDGNGVLDASEQSLIGDEDAINGLTIQDS